MKHLHVDIETYSSVDLKKSGAYKYAESIDFEILCIAYSYGDTVEVCAWDDLPEEVKRDLVDPCVIKIAHNAAFERTCFKAVGLDTGNNWVCTAVLSGYNGLPLALRDVSDALELGDKAKSASGIALIRFFSVPVKPSRVNGYRSRNFPHHDLEKWNSFLEYCKQDVVAEMTIYERLKSMMLPPAEQRCYQVDQEINDIGVRVDIPFIKNVLHLNAIDREKMERRLQEITGLSNPNSLPQLKRWIKERTGEDVKLTKDSLEEMHFNDVEVMELLNLHKRLSRTSITKYDAMLNCAMYDDRIRGLMQFYGASKTGRWAGRLVQPQNLARNYLSFLELVRDIVNDRDYELLTMIFDDVQDVLVQLIRTAFIPSPTSKHLTKSDYSAIEARVVAWLAGEKWRMDVFRSNEKKDIYKESASRMYKKPVENISSEDRQKGKIAELALGYQGGVGALEKMGAGKLGLSEAEMQEIVTKWRAQNPNIVDLWHVVQEAAIRCIKMKKRVSLKKDFRADVDFIFECDDTRMTIQLPSGRKLCYWKAKIVQKKDIYGRMRDNIQYLWADTTTKGKWSWVYTYGGKLVENLTQAVARDFMSEALVRVADAGHKIVMHIHDEIVIENGNAAELEHLMKALPEWAKDFPIQAVGEEVKFYQK